MHLLSENNLALLTSNQVKEICKPLFNFFDVTFFRYLRIFLDGSRIHLCTDPLWTKNFYTKGYYNIAWYDATKIESSRNIETLWDERSIRYDNIVGVEARTYFNIHHGISIVCPGIEYYEVFDFATKVENTEINQVYLSNLDLFERFFFYFRDKASFLISQQEKNRIKPKDLMKRWERGRPEKKLKEIDIQNFIKSTDIKKFFINSISKNIYLTKKEVECIYWSSVGKSAEEIGVILGTSKKTIEVHIDNIKKKMGFNKMTKVIELATRSGLLEIVCSLVAKEL